MHSSIFATCYYFIYYFDYIFAEVTSKHTLKYGTLGGTFQQNIYFPSKQHCPQLKILIIDTILNIIAHHRQEITNNVEDRYFSDIFEISCFFANWLTGYAVSMFWFSYV